MAIVTTTIALAFIYTIVIIHVEGRKWSVGRHIYLLYVGNVI